MILSRAGAPALTIWWLALASVVFYAIWDVRFLPVLLLSALGNFVLAQPIRKRGHSARSLLVVGIAGNLATLAYFKYTNFFRDTASAVLAEPLPWADVVLPIGISFFTFQQIAFLVDTYRGTASEPSFGRYLLFVTFFPQLIAGPIVHHREMMEQFGKPRADRAGDIAEGLAMFSIGLFKKVVIADTIAIPASAVFDAAAGGGSLTAAQAWTGTLAYSLQIYFDFSAYSDMAVGLGRMFGINLPINFASPYKAASIVDFWRRWHITLSRFLRDYLYIPLGGNRNGPSAQKINLLITMALGGIWHGAGWPFLLWGILHGVYLLINHAWSLSRAGAAAAQYRYWPVTAKALTLFCVVVAWVPFRAANMETTFVVWGAMIGLGRDAVSASIDIDSSIPWLIVLLFALAMLAPNAYEIMRSVRMGLPTAGYPATFIDPASAPAWKPSPLHATTVAGLLLAALVKLNDVSEFIYFQF